VSDPERSEQPAMNASRVWYAADVLCLVCLFGYITLLHAGYWVWYVGGLRNRPPFMFDPYIWYLMLATPAAGVCLIALIVRIMVSWPKHIQDSRRLLRLRLLVILGLVLYAGLHFVPLPPGVEDAFLLGYRKYARFHIDVPGIQTWLAALDPNEWIERGSNGRLDYHLVEAERSSWSEIILALKPDVVRPFLDDRGRSAVSLSWSRLHDTWGVEIGHPEMEIEPKPKRQSDSDVVFREREPYRLPLAPGACVWHEPH
jgi:hypothetical protein